VEASREATQEQRGHPADHGDYGHGYGPEQEPDEVRDREEEPEEDCEARAPQVAVELELDGMWSHVADYPD